MEKTNINSGEEEEFHGKDPSCPIDNPPKEFNLSEKIYLCKCKSPYDDYLSVDINDVKEFIKQVKKNSYIDSDIQGNMIMHIDLNTFNKLAGPKLIETERGKSKW